ncbi:hypothetical protein Y032_0056g2719 [Ancylostoma ceylanicum]|uniref:BPTI/Kunitz inhibitor domain-containing protein n=1 Tax=Ancylostoma ceylanicum TaxID=53326 RepID=A0A016U700_9BILA|nr:hypothetical protein Y032_0056g2719 [Ancylostoma ceylanicum]
MKSAVLVLLCAAAATADINPRCYQKIKQGPCLAYFPRYAFDASIGECVEFVYGGCRGNGNRFSSKSECERTCMRSRGGLGLPDIGLLPSYTVCTLPLESGPCYGLMPRYGFDANTGRCVRFVYGGCQGNGNNFETKEECQLTCLKNTPMPIPIIEI